MSARIAATLGLVFALLAPDSVLAQSVRLEARPQSLSLTLGESADLVVRALDPNGNQVDVQLRVAAPFRSLRIENGRVTPLETGEFEIVLTQVVGAGGGQPASVTIPVSVSWPPVDRVSIEAQLGRLYQGVTLEHHASAYHADGSMRPEASVTWRSSNPSVATVDRYGYVHAVGTGIYHKLHKSLPIGTYRRPAPAALLPLACGA